VRVSNRVCILRHEYGVPIIKEMYKMMLSRVETNSGSIFWTDALNVFLKAGARHDNPMHLLVCGKTY
jgi:hypothetical protein